MNTNLKAFLVTLVFLVLPIAYFVYGAVWALFSARGSGWSRGAKVWTLFGYFMIVLAAALWFVNAQIFGSENWYSKQKILFFLSIGLCISSFLAARKSRGSAAAAMVVGGLAVALNWVGTMLPD